MTTTNLNADSIYHDQPNKLLTTSLISHIMGQLTNLYTQNGIERDMDQIMAQIELANTEMGTNPMELAELLEDLAYPSETAYITDGIYLGIINLLMELAKHYPN